MFTQHSLFVSQVYEVLENDKELNISGIETYKSEMRSNTKIRAWSKVYLTRKSQFASFFICLCFRARVDVRLCVHLFICLHVCMCLCVFKVLLNLNFKFKVVQPLSLLEQQSTVLVFEMVL